MDNQRDKQEYPRAELSADNNLFARDKRLAEIQNWLKQQHKDFPLSVLGARESDTALLLEEIERLHLQADAAIEHNARLLSEVSQLREALEVKESEYQSTIRKCNQSTQACLQLREERQKHIDALKEIRDLGTSSNYTVNVAVLTAQAALGIGE